MTTNIKCIHEENYSDGSKTLGMLINYNKEENFKETFVYIYRENMYIFFDTFINMIDYLLYGETKMKRAYIEEKDFDNYYDSECINGKFTDLLKWC